MSLYLVALGKGEGIIHSEPASLRRIQQVASIDLAWECNKTSRVIHHFDFFNLTSSFSIKNTETISCQNHYSCFIAFNRSYRLFKHWLSYNCICSCIPHCEYARWKFWLLPCSYKENKLGSFMYFHDFESTLWVLIYKFKGVWTENFKPVTCSTIDISKIWVKTEI